MNAYFNWQSSTYYNYMAFFRDRVVNIDFELAAAGVMTKLTRPEIDPPSHGSMENHEIDVKKIAETLLLTARTCRIKSPVTAPSVHMCVKVFIAEIIFVLAVVSPSLAHKCTDGAGGGAVPVVAGESPALKGAPDLAAKIYWLSLLGAQFAFHGLIVPLSEAQLIS